MASILRVNTLTDASSNNSTAVSVINQGTVKHWVNYDFTSAAIDGSVNSSSGTDHSAGHYTSNFTSNLTSATDRCHTVNVWNTNDQGSGALGGNERGASGGAVKGNSTSAMTTSSVYAEFLYGANASSNGDHNDFSAAFISTMGDLA
mgnify:CR=1 FL=1|tara:strand:- start:33 stop:473 length:441 start_codon:yes stop_codon:yes gene_type:complete